ncbi:alpha/beta fold hydrolase [Mycobacterium sp. pV006]|uniref:alpha/beta fold hydrolase n=1 Tax=Mycobacterium sp. pV006 TaxID=3238983 RepID=UPI00351B1ACA
MVFRRARRSATLLLASALLAATAVLPPVGSAETTVVIPGASLFKSLNPRYPAIAATYPQIGRHFHGDEHPLVVDYSQDPFTFDRSLRDGVERAREMVRDLEGDVVIVGESMGSMVATRLAEEFAADAPTSRNLRLVLIAPPEPGAARLFKEGAFVPLLNYRVRRMPELPYPTTVVVGEYDPWADPPDRPWNLVAMANAVLGFFYVHGPPSWQIDPADIPPENVTVSGNVTRYFVPTPQLPLTRPLRDLGVPDGVVDVADSILRPVIDAGYRRHDEPGDTRPYLSEGRLLRGDGEEPDLGPQRRRSESGSHADRSPRAERTERTERAEDRDVRRSASSSRDQARTARHARVS